MSEYTLQDSSVTLSCIPREVVPLKKSLRIYSKTAFHQDCCQAIKFCQGEEHHKPEVTTEDEGKVLQVSTSGLEPGAWSLSLANLSDQQSNALTLPTDIPLLFCDVRASIAPGYRIEHVLRLAAGKLDCRRLRPRELALEGETYLEIVKMVHCEKKTAQIKSFKFDHDGNQSDGEEFLDQLRGNHREKYGSATKSLHEMVEKLSEDDTIDIVVVPKIDELDGDFCSIVGGRGYEEEQAEVLKRFEKLRSNTYKSLTELGVTLKSEQPPLYFVHATATKSQIYQLQHMVEFASIVFHDTSVVPDLRDSMNISKAFDAQRMGFDGSGVRVAVFEGGPRDFSSLPFAASFAPSGPVGTTPEEIRDNDHARLTNAIISNKESGNGPRGYAPGCIHFAANDSDNHALDWAVNRMGCTVISQSFHRGSEQTNPALSGDDLLKDAMARLAPFPTIVQAAGNFGPWDDPPSTSAEYVNHKGYNTITVGSHSDDALTISMSSDFRNPGTDRELPLMTANGTDVTALGLTKSGTSFAAPAVAGAVALIQEAATPLTSMPAACRAIMLASADRTTTVNTWWQDVAIGNDRLEGSGALNCEDAIKIAQVRNDGTPVPFAWDGGVIPRSWLDPTTNLIFGRGLRIRVPKESPSGVTFRVKVAVTWDALTHNDFVPNVPSAPSVLYRNFDLLLLDEAGRQVDNSSSLDNNYEIVEFRSGANREYRIVLRLVSSINPNDTRMVLATYGLAWKVIPVT